MAISLSACSTTPTPTARALPDISRANTAIIVIEFQQTWTEKGVFHRMIRSELERNNTVANTIQFLKDARTEGISIIQAPLILDRKNKEQYQKMPLIPKLFRAFTADTWKAEYTEGIYQESDIVVEGRHGFDACEGSDLLAILDSLSVERLLFCGFTTEHCVEMTMNTLSQKGYDCLLISDCTATKSKRLQAKVESRQKSILSTAVFSY
ncbi:MAG: cysteine hydrolase [Bacteroidota bacterium]